MVQCYIIYIVDQYPEDCVLLNLGADGVQCAVVLICLTTTSSQYKICKENMHEYLDINESFQTFGAMFYLSHVAIIIA